MNGALSNVRKVFRGTLLVSIAGMLGAPAPAGECQLEWDPRFGAIGADLAVNDLAVFDEGGGDALYVGGFFHSIGGIAASGIARWDGEEWSAVAGGVSGGVRALRVLNSGDGPALYAGGFFDSAGGEPAGKVARWDGAAWSAVGPALEPDVWDLIVFDEGDGPALFAATDILPGERGGVWKLTVDGWTAVGGGLLGHSPANVAALTVFDDGSGPGLYAGGLFNDAGGVAVSALARWDGESWHDVGGGLNENVWAMEVFDDGRGEALFVGGTFLEAGELETVGLARWDGLQWQAIGPPFPEDFFGIFALAPFDAGDGLAMYASGVHGFDTNRLFRWDGEDLTIASAHGAQTVRALQLLNDGSGPALYMGGTFLSVDGLPLKNIARWRGCVAPEDIDGDGDVDFQDLLVLLASWGACPPPPAACPADIDGDGSVSFPDLLMLLAAWSG